MSAVDFVRGISSNPYVHNFLEVVTSEPARKVYLVGILAGLLAYSIRRAQRLDKLVNNFDDQVNEADEAEMKKPGPAPRTVGGLKRRITAVGGAVDAVKAVLTLKLASYSLKLFVYGLAIPSIVIVAFFYYYGWFFPHATVLDTASASASAPAIAYVVIQQLALGVEGASRELAVLLTPLSLSPSVTRATFNAADPLVWNVILLYRLTVGGFALTLASTFYRFAQIRWLQPKQLKALRKQLKEAEREAAAGAS